jgi:hypothetical protein
MNENRHGNVVQSPRILRRVVGMVVLASAVVGWSVWGLLALAFYVQGWRNHSPLILAPCFFLFILIPMGVIGLLYLPMLITRRISRWAGLDDRKWRRRMLSALAVLVFAASFVLAFLHRSAPAEIWARGEARYVQAHADLEEIREWLSRLGPDDLDPEGRRHASDIVLERSFAKSEQPPALARLKGNRAIVRADPEGHLMLHLQLGGGGFMMHWGLVVGPRDMPTPPSDFSDFGEHRFPLAPGAYIWLAE